MEIITSKQNKKIMEARKLLLKKNRDSTGMFIAETSKVIVEVLKSCNPVEIFVLEGKRFDFLSKLGVEPIYVSEAVFESISSVVSADGIIGVFKKNVLRNAYFGGNFLILDHLQNPDNLGAIFRSALASNFKQVYLIDCVDPYSPKTIRASMGNQFKLSVYTINYDDVKSLFSDSQLYTASMEGQSIFNIKEFSKNSGLVIGNEGNGVSNTLREMIKNTVSIPMENGVESLNASISCAILMYYIYSNNILK